MPAQQREPLGAPAGLAAAEFRQLYEAYFELVWRMLIRFGVREGDALDQAQQVFLTAYLRFDTFQGRSGLRTWLCGISRCIASDYRRTARYRHEVLYSTIDLDELELTAHDEASVASKKRAAEAVLDKLPETQRAVFVLYELEQMDGREIAALLEISLGTVRSRLRLARAAFAREVRRLAAHSDQSEKPAPTVA